MSNIYITAQKGYIMLTLSTNDYIKEATELINNEDILVTGGTFVGAIYTGSYYPRKQ